VTSTLQAREIIIANHRILSYLQKTNITADKTADIIYVQYANKGSGPRADSGKKAGITFSISQLYTGKLINSNRDTAFHQPPVLEIAVGKGVMSKAVDRILPSLRQGAKATIYILAALAAGPRAADPATDLSQDIKFEIEVVRINDKKPRT
jgi:FKBP-type peptidyl-prolyl cis-trans isomerase